MHSDESYSALSRCILTVSALAFCACALTAQGADATPQPLFTSRIIEIPLIPIVKAPPDAVGARGTGVIITPTFDVSITSDPAAADIMATINSAIAVYKAKFSDTVNVTIKFQTTTSGLAQSLTYAGPMNYTDYRAALVAKATTADDQLALSKSVPNTTNNPVTNTSTIRVTTALQRALGNAAAVPPGGDFDSTISLNVSSMNIKSTDSDPSKYSLFSAVSHEMDEVLGFSSGLNNKQNGDPTPTTMTPEDLFRYDGSGNRSFTTNLSSQAWFSIDGTTNIVRFNQTAGGDFSDWYSPGGQTPRVQDAFGTPGSKPVLVEELRALDVIGYTPGTGTGGGGGSTTTTAANANSPQSSTAQNVTLSATVTSGGGTVNEGTVSFQVKNGANNLGTAVVSNTVSNGAASVTYSVPANTPVGTYTIVATYSGGPTFTGSSDSTHTLSVTVLSITSAASYTPPAFIGLPTAFTVGASGSAAATLNYAWDFGDGGTDTSGASVSHTYTATGKFTAKVTVTDGLGGSVSSSVAVTVYYPVYTTSNDKQKFSLNFKTGKDSISTTTFDTNFFNSADGTKVSFIIGDVLTTGNVVVVDSGTLLKNKAKGALGNFTLNTRAGTLAYTTTKAQLQSAMAPFGAKATNPFGAITVPLYYFFHNGFYGAKYSFFYQTNKSGTMGKAN